MKKLFIIIFISIFGIQLVSAQQLKVNSTIKGNYDSFITKATSRSSYMTVANNKNVYDKKPPRNRNIDLVTKIREKDGMLKAFLKVFSDDRLKQLLPERALVMTFYVNPSGQIMEITFTVPKNTLLTALEIEELEKAIKANVTFYFDPKQINGQNFIDIEYGVNYQRVINRGTFN